MTAKNHTPSFLLIRTPFGKLAYTGTDGITHEGVMPVRSFPMEAPNWGISIVNVEGQELSWIEELSALPQEQQTLIADELSAREFVPEIQQIQRVSSFATPSTWFVQTDRGETSFVLRGEEDIRRLPGGGLLIADSHGVQFRIKELVDLDRGSRKILDRFL